MANDLPGLLFAQTWQLAALVGGVLLANRFIARDRPHLAHALWLVVLLKCVTPPLWSSPSGVFCWLQPAASSDVRPVVPPAARELALPPLPQAGPQDVVVALVPQPHNLPPAAQPAEESAGANWALWLAIVWLAGAGLSLGIAVVRWTLFLCRLHRFPRHDDAGLTALVQRLARKLRVGRRVRLLITESRIGPAVIGLVRPTILLPAAIVAGRPPHELEPILAHEVLHVRRGDLWLAAAQVLAQSLWWFHPLVWLANRLLSREAERCCDEQVLAELGCEPARYARSLLDILQLKHELLAVPAFPGVRPVDVTSNRLERIMRLGHGCQRRTPWWCWLVMLLAAAIVLPGAAFVAGAKERPGKLKQIGWKQSAAAATQATPATPAEGTGERVTRVYPARDLLARLMEELRVDEAQAREDLRGHVIGLAQLQDPQLAWEGKKLVATHSAAQHERVAAALAQLREFGVRQITLSVRMVSGPPALLERFPIRWSAADTALAEPGVRPTSQVFAALDFEPLPLPAEAKPGESWTQAASVIEKNMPVLYAVLTAEQARPLIETAQGDSRANILQSPKVTVFNGQRATVMDATQRPFVVGVKPVASDDPSAPPAFEPQIRVVSEGTTLRMRPVLQARDQLRLDYEFTLASVRSVETAKIPQGKGAEPLTVQVPEVASVRFCSSLQMPLGRTLAVGVLTKQGAKPGAMVVLLEVNDIKPAGDHQAAPVAAKDSPTLPAPRAVAGASHLTAAEAALEERLQRKIFAAHGRMTLDQAIEAISKAAGINILIDQRGLAAEGVTLDTPVQVQRQGVAVAAGTLLRQLLEPLEMAFVIENECLRVTGASELRKPFTKVYLVADLIAAVPQIVGVVDGKPLPPPAVAKADFDPLIQLITTTIAPQSWDSTGGPGSLSAFETNMSLVVSQSQEVHEQIADTLQQLRRLRDQQVVLELQLLCVEKTFFERLGLDLVIEPADDKASIARARLTAQQAASLLRAVGPAPRGSSRLTLLNGQAGDLDLPLGGKERKVNLKLVPRIRFDARSILLELAVGSEEGEDAAAKSVDLICDAGQVLLLDVTDRIPAAGVPMLTKLPHVGPLFKQTPPAGSRVLLLVTPEIHFGEEVVVGEASRAAATHAAASAKQH